MSTSKGAWNRSENRMRRLNAVTATAVVSLVLAGCVTAPLDAVDWQHGARRGHVVSTYAADLPPAQLPKCLANLPLDQYAAQRFVQVRYHHGRLMLSAVAPMPPTLDVKDGDIVELWPADCAAGNIARITRKLSTQGQ
ncbi:hypothetical protein [Rugamonas rivuli]|uniref:Lipoprotein n=1 Tax=Rugamonas rivuli TaxID=2743358 RepID=A0A843S2G0_9BURK|nr:hypothetical protein [Rugamonas rivuli]MQA18445.1 hypothetical protein [Rugamonas rivuli]